MSSRDARWLVIVALAASVTLAGCDRPVRLEAIALRGGNADRGKQTILRYGCDACHAISGLPDPIVPVAAPITGIADRRFIAGTLANTPDNLIMWIRFPHSVKPGTSMPDLGVSARDARDIATYLYSLR